MTSKPRWCYSCGDVYVVDVGLRHKARGSALLQLDGSVCTVRELATLAQLRAEGERLAQLVRCPVCRQRLYPAPEELVDV